MVTAELRTAATKVVIKVAGGQIMRSALPVSRAAPAMILASSASEEASPFIFQFPATSGIILPAIEKSLSACGYQTGWGNARAPRGKPILVRLQGVGLATMVHPPAMG